MLIKKGEVEQKKFSDNFIVHEYNLPTEEYSLATCFINQRHPEKGMVANMNSDEVYFVLDGKGEVITENDEAKIKKGDVYVFEKGKKYAVLGKKLKLALFNVPKWTPDEHKVFEK